MSCLNGHASAQFILRSAVEMRPAEVQNQVCQGSKVNRVAHYHWRLQMFVNVSKGARYYDPSVGIVIKTSSICQGTHGFFAGKIGNEVNLNLGIGKDIAWPTHFLWAGIRLLNC